MDIFELINLHYIVLGTLLIVILTCSDVKSARLLSQSIMLIIDHHAVTEKQKTSVSCFVVLELTVFLFPSRCLIPGCPLSSRSGLARTRVRSSPWTLSLAARLGPPVSWLRWTWYHTASLREWWGGLPTTEWQSRWWDCRTCLTLHPVSATTRVQWAQTTTRAMATVSRWRFSCVIIYLNVRLSHLIHSNNTPPRFICVWDPPGLLFLPYAKHEGVHAQEEHQQGQRRVPPEAREEQHRCEEEPGQGPQEDPADPAEGRAAAGREPEAADEDRAANTGAGHSQTHPVAATPAGSRGRSSRGVQHLKLTLTSSYRHHIHCQCPTLSLRPLYSTVLLLERTPIDILPYP